MKPMPGRKTAVDEREKEKLFKQTYDPTKPMTYL